MARPLKALPRRQDRRNAGAQGSGWMLPLLFCLAVLACAAGAWIFRQSAKQDPPAIDPELAEIASAWTLDLTDEQGGHLKEEMASAATGLDSHAARDAKVGELGRRALDQGRIDAACAAVLFLNGPEMRLALLRDIEKKAAADCATLPWGVFAVRNMAGDAPEMARTLADQINARWESCGRSLGPDYQEGSPLPGTRPAGVPGEGQEGRPGQGRAEGQSGEQPGEDGPDDSQAGVIPPSRPMPAAESREDMEARTGGERAGERDDERDDDDGREPARVLPSPDGTTEFGAHDDDRPDDDAEPDEHDIKN